MVRFSRVARSAFSSSAVPLFPRSILIESPLFPGAAGSEQFPSQVWSLISSEQFSRKPLCFHHNCSAVMTPASGFPHWWVAVWRGFLIDVAEGGGVRIFFTILVASSREYAEFIFRKMYSNEDMMIRFLEKFSTCLHHGVKKKVDATKIYPSISTVVCYS